MSRKHIIRQLTDKDALIDALISLYHSATKCQPNDNLNKFIQLYKPVYYDIIQSRLSIKDFQIVHKDSFAEGAFGKVMIVKSKDNQIYAMKTSNKAKLIHQMDRSSPMEERLLLSIATEKDDPWFPKLHASFQDRTNLYLVMEYAPGGDLQGLMERRSYAPFAEEEARFYCAELVLAIERVHKLGFMHRDIKPGNILIDKTGHIKLGDFGSCISIDTKDYLFMVGTMPYVSPEMCNSEGSNPLDGPAYGPEVDWWSVGIVLYELLYGDTPFIGTDIKIQMSLLDPKIEVQYNPNIETSSEAQDLISRLLSKSKDKRLGFRGVEEIKSHSFFSSINWNSIRTTATPPFVPIINSPDDVTFFSTTKSEDGTAQWKENDSMYSDSFEDDLNDHEYPFIGYTNIYRGTNQSGNQVKQDKDTKHYQDEIDQLQERHLKETQKLEQEIQQLKSKLETDQTSKEQLPQRLNRLVQQDNKTPRLDERMIQLQKKEKQKLQDQMIRMKQDYEQQMKKVQQERASLQASFNKQLVEKEKLQAALELNHASSDFQQTIQHQQSRLEELEKELQEKSAVYEQTIQETTWSLEQKFQQTTEAYEQEMERSRQRIDDLEKEKEEQMTVIKEQQDQATETTDVELTATLKRLEEKLEYEVEKTNKLRERFKQKLKDQYQDFKLLIQQARDESYQLRQQLEKHQEHDQQQQQQQMKPSSEKRKSLPRVPHHTQFSPPEESKTIATTMWKRDRESLKMAQQALGDSEDQLSYAKKQIARLKKEIKYYQNHSYEHTTKTDDYENNDYEYRYDKKNYDANYHAFRNKIDYTNSKPSYYHASKPLPSSEKPTVYHDYTGLESKSKFYKSIQHRSKPHSDRAQDIIERIQQEKDFIQSTQKTLLARARLSRTRNDVDKELKVSLERSYYQLSILEAQLKSISQSPCIAEHTKINAL